MDNGKAVATIEHRAFAHHLVSPWWSPSLGEIAGFMDDAWSVLMESRQRRAKASQPEPKAVAA